MFLKPGCRLHSLDSEHSRWSKPGATGVCTRDGGQAPYRFSARQTARSLWAAENVRDLRDLGGSHFFRVSLLAQRLQELFLAHRFMSTQQFE